MEITETKLIKLSLCAGDMNKLNVGESIHFTLNNSQFELIGAALKPVNTKQPAQEPNESKKVRRRARTQAFLMEIFEALPQKFNYKLFFERANERSNKFTSFALRAGISRLLKKLSSEGRVERISKSEYRKLNYSEPKKTDAQVLIKSFKSGELVQCSVAGKTMKYSECRACPKRVRESGSIIFCGVA